MKYKVSIHRQCCLSTDDSSTAISLTEDRMVNLIEIPVDVYSPKSTTYLLSAGE